MKNHSAENCSRSIDLQENIYFVRASVVEEE